MAKVVLFSTSTCSWCRRAKNHFTENRVPFKEVNVESDPDAARDLQIRTGQTGVPVIKIGSKWIVGFDKPAIDHELARGKVQKEDRTPSVRLRRVYRNSRRVRASGGREGDLSLSDCGVGHGSRDRGGRDDLDRS